jgi:hypothetical protein
MLLPTAPQVEFLNQLSLQPPQHRQRYRLATVGIPRPELAGRKVRVLGESPLYVIDRLGCRRLIPFPLTFMNLFRDAAVCQGVLVANSVADIPEGPALDDGALLLRGRCSERIYILDQGCKRLIAGPDVMRKYDFAEESVMAVPQILVDALPEGEVWG